MYNVEYLGAEVASRTTYKSVADGYNRDYFSVVKRGSVFWVESRSCPSRTYSLVIKETKRIFPQLTYLYDLK